MTTQMEDARATAKADMTKPEVAAQPAPAQGEEAESGEVEPIRLPRKLAALLSHRMLAKEALILTYRREKSPSDNQKHFDFALAALSREPQN